MTLVIAECHISGRRAYKSIDSSTFDSNFAPIAIPYIHSGFSQIVDSRNESLVNILFRENARPATLLVS